MNALKQIRKAYKDRSLAEITEASLIETFGDKNPGTYNKLVAIVRSALRGAYRSGWIESVPHIGKRKEPPPLTAYLTARQWRTLRAELPDHLQRMAEFSIATGLRWSNVAGLTWDRVDLRRRNAWIGALEAKGRRPIQVPLSSAAVAALRRVPGERIGFVFTYRGKPISSPKTAWRKACKRAGLSGLRWHDLRHTWASWHATRGTPPDVLQRLGGWRSPQMVQRYAHLAPSYIARFADNAKPVGKAA